MSNMHRSKIATPISTTANDISQTLVALSNTQRMPQEFWSRKLDGNAGNPGHPQLGPAGCAPTVEVNT